MALSQKQHLSYHQATHRINIWVGAVRSGKTYSSLLKLIDIFKNGPQGDIMIIGVSRESIQRNILGQLYTLMGFPIPSSKTNETKLFNHRVYFVGASDEGAVRKIQGATLAAAYVDEVACIPQPFFKMLLSRISVKGAQLLATCNPEGPAHWLKKEYIDRCRELDLAYWNFTLDDNPSLDPSFVENLKKEYTGSWYRRLILGEWALAQGVVYPDFDDLNKYKDDYPNPNFYVAGIDYGTTNPTCCLVAGMSPKQWPQIHVEKEYYYDGNVTGRQKSDSELADEIKDFLANYNLRAVYIDPAAASLKVELRNRGLPVQDAKNDVLFGIKTVNKFIANKNLVVHISCKNLLEQIQSYAWDPKAALVGIDKPIKINDHSCDSLRYLILSTFPEGLLGHIDDNITIEQVRRQIYDDSGWGGVDPISGNAYY